MNKIIFLDIDGVFNNINSKLLIENKPMDNLAKIIYYTNAKIVIISSWATLWIYSDKYNSKSSNDLRSLFENRLINSLRKYGVEYDIKDLSFLDYEINKTTIETIDLVNLLDDIKYEDSRQYEIDMYIKNNNIENANYIIIDDCNSLYNKENFIQTSYYDENKMLSNDDADIAIKKLNKKLP